MQSGCGKLHASGKPSSGDQSTLLSTTQGHRIPSNGTSQRISPTSIDDNLSRAPFVMNAVSKSLCENNVFRGEDGESIRVGVGIPFSGTSRGAALGAVLWLFSEGSDP